MGEPTSESSVTYEKFLALNQEIHALVRAGFPLHDGLKWVARTNSDSMGEMAREIETRLSQGQSLARAVKGSSTGVPPMYISLLQHGIRSGNMAAALEVVTRHARRMVELRSMVGQALWYPILVLVLAYVLSVVFMTVVFPQFAAGFETLRLDPGLDVSFLNQLHGSLVYWVWIPPVGLLMLTWWWKSSAFLDGTSWSRGILYGVPWMRSIIRCASIASFAEQISLLIAQKVPLPEALEWAAAGSGSRRLENAGRTLAEAIRGGRPLAEAISGSHKIPPMIGWLLVTADKQPSLEKSLDQVSRTYRDRVAYQVDVLSTVLPITLMIAIGAVSALVYGLLLFVPLSRMLRELSA